MKVAVVRGAFLNQFEMQSFSPLAKKHQMTAFASLKPIHDEIGFQVIKLPCPMDALTLLNSEARRILRGVLNRVFIDAHYLFGLEKKLRGFDIVHCAETYFHYTQQCLTAKKKGWVKKVVCSVSDTIPFNNETILGRKKFKKRARKEVDLFLARTSLAKKALIAEGCNPEKIVVVPHGIEIKKFKIKKSQPKADRPLDEKIKMIDQNSKITILFVGRLEEEKGIKELLKAFKQITNNPAKVEDSTRGASNQSRRSRGSPTESRYSRLVESHRTSIEASGQLTIKLRIIGEGSLKGWIRQWIEKNGQHNIVTIEQCDYQDIAKVYQDADIFVLPSKKTKIWQEHFGMVLLEAMVSSLPIVATKSGAIAEVVGKCGFLVKEQDVKGLCMAIEKLIKDKSLRIKLGKMGRERVEKYFDSEKIAKKIEKTYENLSNSFN